jgi:hypothetical protein
MLATGINYQGHYLGKIREHQLARSKWKNISNEIANGWINFPFNKYSTPWSALISPSISVCHLKLYCRRLIFLISMERYCESSTETFYKGRYWTRHPYNSLMILYDGKNNQGFAFVIVRIISAEETNYCKICQIKLTCYFQNTHKPKKLNKIRMGIYECIVHFLFQK